MQQVFDFFSEENSQADAKPEAGQIVDWRVGRALAKAAEFLVAYDISRRGHDVFTVGEGLRYDLIADIGIGAIRRVQVKSNQRAVLRSGVSLSYTFCGQKSLLDYRFDVDLFAFVALDKGLVFYVLPEEIKGPSFHINAANLTPETCKLSWDRLFRYWFDRTEQEVAENRRRAL